jgi:Clp amino terminal domain, pathogenicity island component
MARFTDTAGLLPHLAREEAERRHQYYLGPEHLLLGLLVEDDTPAVTELRAHGVHLEVGDDNPAARVLHAHGLNAATVWAGIDRLVAEGVLLGPQPSDGELLATLGVDLDGCAVRLRPTVHLPSSTGDSRRATGPARSGRRRYRSGHPWPAAPPA